MAVFPSDSVRTKDWGTEVLTDADQEAQLDLLHAYLQASLNGTSGHSHTGSSNQGPKISPANLLIASQATGDTLYASSATAWARLAKGTANQVFKMKSDASIPEWGDGTTYASAAEVKTGTEAAKAVAPSTMIGHEGVAKAWVSFDGTGTIAIKSSYNVSGIVDNSTGNYTITWDVDFADNKYCVVGMCSGSAVATLEVWTPSGTYKTAGAVTVQTKEQGGTTTYTSDQDEISVLAIGAR